VTYDLLQRVIVILGLRVTPQQESDLRRLFNQPVLDIAVRPAQEVEVAGDRKTEVAEQKASASQDVLTGTVPHLDWLLSDCSELKVKVVAMLADLKRECITSELRAKELELKHEQRIKEIELKHERQLIKARQVSDENYAKLLSISVVQKNNNMCKILNEAIMHNVEADIDQEAKFAQDIADIYLDVCGVSIPANRYEGVKQFVRSKYEQEFHVQPVKRQKYQGGNIFTVDRYPKDKQGWIGDQIHARFGQTI